MNSSDYRDRFVAEYIQTKIRYEKLKAFCDKIEAARVTKDTEVKAVEEPKHDCPLHLLRSQQRAMGEYLHILELRAIIEDVDLADAMMYMRDKKAFAVHSVDVDSKSTCDKEDEALKLSLSECEDDFDVLGEAIARIIAKGLFNDSDEEKIYEASLKVLHRVKQLDAPCEAVKEATNAEKRCDNCAHLPICEYCSVHLKGFTFPSDTSCDMFLRVGEAKNE